MTRKIWNPLLWPEWFITALYVVLCAAILAFMLFCWGYDAWAQDQQISIPPDTQEINRAYRFTGRWVPDESSVSAGADPTNLNYITLRNLRYAGAGTGTSLEGVLGYTKVNTTPISTYTKIRNGHQLFVNATDTASHVLVQGVASNGSSAVFLNSAQITNQGNFTSTIVHTDAAGAGLGRFSTGAGDVLVYSNGVENRVWGGNETRASAFYMVTNSSGWNPNDYTEAAESSLDDSASCIPIGDSQRFWIVMSTRALRGVKYTVKTANSVPANATAKYWDGTAFSSVAGFSDGTSVGGKSLAQSGWMTFTSTVGSAKPYHFEGKYLYAYLFEISAGSASVSHVTVDAPWQAIPDVWDGSYRTNRQMQVIKGGIARSYTLETQDESSTQYPIAGLFGGVNATDYAIVMFKERIAGLKFKFIADSVNTNPSEVTVYYNNGTEWANPSALTDGTSNGTCSLSRDGIMTWNPPAKETEFPQTLYGSTGYAYKLAWSATLGNSTSTAEESVGVDVISGIPAPNPPAVAKFSSSYQGRLMLCNFESKGQANRIDFSYPNAPDIWNGEQTSNDGEYSLYFGASSEPIVAATEIFNRIGNSPNSMFVVLKKTSTYMTIGTDSATASRTLFTNYTVSNTVGCAAPLTLATCEMGYDVAESVQRNLAIWLSYSGPYTFDGMVLQPIPGISSYFNPAESKCINFKAIENSRAWYDSTYREYNLLIPSGTGQTENNVWLVYDMVRKKWFEKNVGYNANLYPISGFPVQDEYGSRYIYAGRNDGYMMRLEDGTSWDSTAIDQTVETGDFFFSDNLFMATTIRNIKVIASRIDESHNLSLYHIADTADDGVYSSFYNTEDFGWINTPDFTWGSGSVISMSLNLSNSSATIVKKTAHVNLTGLLHRLKFTVSTSNTKKGFRPIGFILSGYEQRGEYQ